MKKTALFFLLFTLSKLVFCQEENKKGTIKVAKAVSPCLATILGYSGQNNIPRSKLLKFEKIELNKGCNYKVVSFQLAYLSNDTTIKLNTTGELISPETISAIQNTSYVIFEQIIAQNVESGNEIILPSIVFTIGDRYGKWIR
jgi:hypothetical protein